MKIVLFDIDNTIANSTWRNALKPPNGSWDDYHSACTRDRVNEEIAELIVTLSLAGYSCLGFTRRPEKWRSATNLWIMNNNVSLSWFFMADDKDYGNHIEVKVAMLEKHFSEPQRRDIRFIVDDDPETCAAITEKYGITSFNYRSRHRN